MKSEGYQCYQSGSLRRALSIVLIFSQTFSVYAAIPAQSGITRSVYIQRIGRLDTANQVVYPKLEKKIQRWLENIENLHLATIRLSTPLIGDNLEMELVSMELRQITNDLKKKIFTGSDLDGVKALVEKMVEKRKLLSGVANFGPDIQESLVFEAAYYWKILKREKTRELLHRALMIHPQGLVKDLADWEFSTSAEFNWVGFDLVVAQEQKLIKRGCALQLEIQPKKSQLKVNGFQIQTRDSISLPIGTIHHLSANADGFNSGDELIRCNKIGKKIIKMKLDVKIGVNSKSAGTPILLVKLLRDEYKLFLYTPKKAIDEIPLAKPIRVTDLVNQDDDSPILVANDAVLDIFQRHNIAALENRELGRVDGDLKNSAFMTLDARVKGTTNGGAWYKSPVFWGIIGGLVAGGAVTYFATRSSGDVNSIEIDPGAMAR